MDLAGLIEGLSNPAAFPFDVDAVEVLQTHISVVFLAGTVVYKIKKPVNLGFLDFSTLAKRRHFCDEEIRLNRRLAPGVYRGVVPITRQGPGLAFEGGGEAVEWAVKMKRLPEQATLEARLAHGAVGEALVADLARRIAAFHGQAEHGERIAACGQFQVVADNARENFKQSTPQIGQALSRRVFDRLQALTEAALAQWRELIESRAARGVPCDTHGDLRLGHVYLLGDRAPPLDMVVIDCIEFNEQFRYADPVADMAFLVMELKRARRNDLARVFVEAYFHATLDGEGCALMPLYTAYRAAVRGKVDGLKASEPEVPAAERAAALDKSRAHWLLALGELEQPGRRPGLVLVGGLPGTGKSTLAAQLAERAGFLVIRSDLIRKELAGVTGSDESAAAFGAGIYSPEWTARTYSECLRRAEAALFEGQRVVVDASFREELQRRAFLESAAQNGVPAVLLVCQAEPNTVRQRLASRRGDASDADWTIYLRAAKCWEPPSATTLAMLRTVDTDEPGDPPIEQALAALREIELTE